MTENNTYPLMMTLRKAKEKMKTARIDYDFQRYEDSISRAYYAVFHAISAVLLSKGLHYSSHSQTIGYFNKEFIKTGVFPKEFSKNIQKLFNDRQTGDYGFEIFSEPDTAKEDMEMAEKIIKACEDYVNNILEDV